MEKYSKEYFAEMHSVIDHKPIVETGRIYFGYDGKHTSINYSRILDELIHACGRFCERFASDLFIDWTSLMDYLNSEVYEDKMYLFGIRQNGVDHLSWVVNRYNSNDEKEYRALYRLCIVFVEEDNGYEVTMTLDRIK